MWDYRLFAKKIGPAQFVSREKGFGKNVAREKEIWWYVLGMTIQIDVTYGGVDIHWQFNPT